MTQRTLTEEKKELHFKLLEIIAKLEQVKVYKLGIVNIIPIGKGLKVVYTVTRDRVIQWSRTIKYSDLANEI